MYRFQVQPSHAKSAQTRQRKQRGLNSTDQLLTPNQADVHERHHTKVPANAVLNEDAGTAPDSSKVPNCSKQNYSQPRESADCASVQRRDLTATDVILGTVIKTNNSDAVRLTANAPDDTKQHGHQIGSSTSRENSSLAETPTTTNEGCIPIVIEPEAITIKREQENAQRATVAPELVPTPAVPSGRRRHRKRAASNEPAVTQLAQKTVTVKSIKRAAKAKRPFYLRNPSPDRLAERLTVGRPGVIGRPHTGGSLETANRAPAVEVTKGPSSLVFDVSRGFFTIAGAVSSGGSSAPTRPVTSTADVAIRVADAGSVRERDMPSRRVGVPVDAAATIDGRNEAQRKRHRAKSANAGRVSHAAAHRRSQSANAVTSAPASATPDCQQTGRRSRFDMATSTGLQLVALQASTADVT